jgi:hypothetical protein
MKPAWTLTVPDLDVLASTIHYEEAGNGAPIVLLHGNPPRRSCGATSSQLWLPRDTVWPPISSGWATPANPTSATGSSIMPATSMPGSTPSNWTTSRSSATTGVGHPPSTGPSDIPIESPVWRSSRPSSSRSRGTSGTGLLGAVTVVAGINDIIRPRLDLDAALLHMDEMLRDLRPIGSTVVTATFPNFSPINPVARLARWRLHYFNSGLRAIAAGRGAPLVEAEDFPTLADRRMWCDDRLHLSPEGHRGLASATAANARVGPRPCPACRSSDRSDSPLSPAAPRRVAVDPDVFCCRG